METAAHPRSLFKPRPFGKMSVTLTSSASLQTGVVKTFRCVTQIARMLDVHISDSPDDASRVAPSCSFAFDVHRTFFATLNDSKCPLLGRMRDFYTDCSYSGAEIALLASEIDSLLPTLDQRTQHFSTLQTLRAACDIATHSKQSLFVFCD